MTAPVISAKLSVFLVFLCCVASLSDPYLRPGVFCRGLGGGLQQTQEPLPQPDACRRCHTDCPLPALQDWRSGTICFWFLLMENAH